ncbi:thiamine-phosphate diphosphorylase [Candidatus Peregrinibacteria bacterium RIFOXYB2_FULL_32_7]|nr:MAG: thiamine-phosphate diphosphorylase [Candidatus Peregrinibacteria bacterium RIFOXYB2_FULL_32_7]OGQ76297.1 MAG: thiamine-phosphate diphosphorylase [Deltaproteobacteria bacterium RIFOXYA2_FULL_42_10]
MKNFGLYCITDNRNNPISIIKIWIKLGVPMIQFRNKEMDNKEFADMAWEIRKLTWGTKSKFIINDRIEIAKDVDADGLHLGQEDLKNIDYDLKNLRKYLLGQNTRLGKEKIIGLSSHSFDQAKETAKLEPDYLSIGPFFTTPTKPTYTPIGFTTVKKVVEEIKNIPIVTIGGINSKNLKEVLKTGIKNVAMVREVNENID